MIQIVFRNATVCILWVGVVVSAPCMITQMRGTYILRVPIENEFETKNTL